MNQKTRKKITEKNKLLYSYSAHYQCTEQRPCLLALGDELYPNNKKVSIQQAVCPDLYKAQGKIGNKFI